MLSYHIPVSYTHLSRQVSLVYQNPEEMFIQDSIQADIAYAMRVRGEKDWQERTRQLLERCLLYTSRCV